MSNERYPLYKIFIEDIFLSNKLALLLLLSVITSALFVISVTFETRELVAKKNDLLLDVRSFEEMYRNLQMEENIQSDSYRIEGFARTVLKMDTIKNEQVVLIVE